MYETQAEGKQAKIIAKFEAYKATRLEFIISEGRSPLRLLLPRYLKESEKKIQCSDACITTLQEIQVIKCLI